MKTKYFIGFILSSLIMISCMDQKKSEDKVKKSDKFSYNVEQFADIKVLRYQIPRVTFLWITMPFLKRR